jgi:hypothetical protein
MDTGPSPERPPAPSPIRKRLIAGNPVTVTFDENSAVVEIISGIGGRGRHHGPGGEVHFEADLEVIDIEHGH